MAHQAEGGWVHAGGDGVGGGADETNGAEGDWEELFGVWGRLGVGECDGRGDGVGGVGEQGECGVDSGGEGE